VINTIYVNFQESSLCYASNFIFQKPTNSCYDHALCQCMHHGSIYNLRPLQLEKVQYYYVQQIKNVTAHANLVRFSDKVTTCVR